MIALEKMGDGLVRLKCFLFFTNHASDPSPCLVGPTYFVSMADRNAATPIVVCVHTLGFVQANAGLYQLKRFWQIKQIVSYSGRTMVSFSGCLKIQVN